MIIVLLAMLIIGLMIVRRYRLSKIPSAGIPIVTTPSASTPIITTPSTSAPVVTTPPSSPPVTKTPPVSIPKDVGLKAGDYNYSIKVGNTTRRYLLHVPANFAQKKNNALILAFHGGMGSAEIMAENYGWKEKSDQEGFIVAFPNGASRLPSGKIATWNAGNCCGYATEIQSADTAFVKAMIGDIKAKINIKNIFATGMSNGGMFSHRLACEMSDTFSAIAAVSGTNNFENCHPQKPISILHIHGLEDDRVLFNGGCGPKCIVKSETEYVSVPKTIADWVEKNKCNKTPQRSELNANAYCDLYTKCANNVQVKLCVAKDGGHSWPGATKTPNLLEKSAPSQAINATDEIWNFFKENL